MVNPNENTGKVESSSVSVDLEGSNLSKSEKVNEFLGEFGECFSDNLGLTHIS